MSFKLRKNEGASAGIRRVAREEIDEAMALLEAGMADTAKAIHELRKRVKRIRAVVRLVRGELGEDAYRRDNGVLRGFGRRLSPTRDAAVRVSALDLLREASEKDFPADEMASIRKRLAVRHRAAVRRLRSGSTLSSIARGLHDLRRRVRTWPLTKDGFPCLEPGLRKAYRLGRRAEAKAYASRSDDAFHEWRKRAKDLRYHFQVLEPVRPKVMEDVEKALHDLTDRLGDDHDLSDLHHVLTVSAGLTRGTKTKDVARVIDLIGRRRSELQADARPIVARIYAEKPELFSTRIESYWEAWRS